MSVFPVILLGQTVGVIGPGTAPSRVDIFAGYSFFSPFGSDINLSNYESIHAGAVFDATYYLNRRYGIQAEASLFPKGPQDNNCVNSAQIGPVARMRRGRFMPFIHTLAGAAQAGGPQNQLCSVWGWGVTGGIGVDYQAPFLPERFAIRPVQFDFTYSHINNGPINYAAASGGLGEVYAFRFTSGISLRIDGVRFVRPTLVCSANPEIAYAGDPITLTGNVVNAQRAGEDHFNWIASGGRIGGEGASAPLDTAGLKPGMYRVTGRYYQGKKAHHTALCTTEFQIREISRPTVACVSDRPTANQGDVVTIHATGESPLGRPLTYSYQTSSGEISGTTNQASLSTANARPGDVQVRCTVTDDTGQVASAVALIGVTAKAPEVEAAVVPPVAPAPAAPMPAVPPPAPAPAPEASRLPPPFSIRPVPDRTPSRAPARGGKTTAAPKGAPAPASKTAPPAPAAVEATGQIQRMCTISFPAAAGQTTKAGDQAKPCLDRTAEVLRRDKSATLILTGEYAAGEVNGRAVERILSAADYLSKTRGIAAGRLHMRLGKARARALLVTVVPTGAPDEAINKAGLGDDVDLGKITWRAPAK